jgi:hypothetical protein
MNLKMAAKVRFYLRVCLVDIDMNDVIFPFANLPSFSFANVGLAANAFLSCSLSLSLSRALEINPTFSTSHRIFFTGTENLEGEEEEEEEEEATTSEGATATPPLGMKPWIGLQSMPQPTRDKIAEHMRRQQTETGDNELTVVLIGRQGVGKSSTVNALINEKVANDQPFVQETVRPLLASRAAGGFNVHVIDTPGLLDGESVSSNGLMALRAALDDRKVHCFVFMQRLDSWRCDSGDELMIRALCQHCGADVFDRVVLGFSHGELKPPNGETTQKLIERRYAQTVSMIKTELKKARKKNYNDFSPPMAVVENSSRCPTNDEGEKCVTLENDEKVPWLPALVGAMVDASIQSVKKADGDGKSYYLFDYKKIKKSGANPNTRHKLWMFPAFLVQWFVLRPIIVKVIRNDIRKDRAIDRYAL